jgi:hypothetical protein
MSWKIWTPGGDMSAMAYIEGVELTIAVPLTPTMNVWQRLHWASRGRYSHTIEPLVLASARRVLGTGYPRPWAKRATISVVRCSRSNREADTDNVIGGHKAATDAIVRAGLIPDDDPASLTWGSVDDRTPKNWGDRQGPATWITLRKAE